MVSSSGTLKFVGNCDDTLELRIFQPDSYDDDNRKFEVFGRKTGLCGIKQLQSVYRKFEIGEKILLKNIS